MNIKKAERTYYYTTYSKLQNGTVFKFTNGNDNIFMKIDEEQSVCLNDPEIVYFEQCDEVREIKAELQLMED